MKKQFNLQLGDGVLTRYVDSKKHYFIKFKAYAYDEVELRKYAGSFHTIRIITSKGNIYEITSDEFYAKSYLNREYGKLQRLINVADLHLVGQKSKSIHLPQELYMELKKESERTGLPMTALVQVKKKS